MDFNIQPTTLHNELLQLIPLQQNDFEDLYAVASDPLIWEQHPNPLRYQREVFKVFFDEAIASNGAFLIRDTTTNAVVGSSRYYDYDANHHSIKLGYTFIGRAYWGQNYNRALKKLMLDYVFQYVNAVHLHIGASNIRSQIATGRIGAVKIDEIEVHTPGELPKLNYIYQIKKEDYNL